MLVSMLQAKTPERIEELMALSRADGAEGFGMQFEQLEVQYRKKEVYQRLFAKASPLPVYVTNYRGGRNEHKKSDEVLVEELCELAECGATLIDLMGDLFDKQDDQVARDEAAIQKQMAVIEGMEGLVVTAHECNE